jgi:hypothetical protein
VDKRTFKSRFHRLLDEQVDGIPSEQKIKYMKKWIRDYENKEAKDEPRNLTTNSIHIDSSKKIGVLVRSTLDEIIKRQLLGAEKVSLLQDERHCKNLFDINYPMLKKVNYRTPLLEQRRVNGYDRYWAETITIQDKEYLVCNDWSERNKPKFISWVMSLE